MKHIYLILLVFSFNLNAEESFTSDQFLNEWSAPLYSEQAKPIIYTGSAITAAIIMGRDSGFDQFQEDMAEDEPMGDLAHFGDYMGQLVPNLLYMGGMYWNHKSSKSNKSLRRAMLMFKTTLYSGITTGILKRVVNQKRPHGGDRLSFPSGHTTTAFAFASVVGLEHNKAWAIGAYSIATIVAFSRLNDNAHYLHDVAFGATIGIAYGVSLYHIQQKESSNSDVSWMVLPSENGATATLSYQFN